MTYGVCSLTPSLADVWFCPLVRLAPIGSQTHLGHVQAEKEDTVARLHGAENVRAFLMDKLKDLEDELARTLDASTKKDEQAALDREIIGFLDARTQEYELTLKKCTKQNDEYRVALARLEEEHAAKTSVRSVLWLRLPLACAGIGKLIGCVIVLVWVSTCLRWWQILQDMVQLLNHEKQDLELQLRVRTHWLAWHWR